MYIFQRLIYTQEKCGRGIKCSLYIRALLLFFSEEDIFPLQSSFCREFCINSVNAKMLIESSLKWGRFFCYNEIMIICGWFCWIFFAVLLLDTVTVVLHLLFYLTLYIDIFTVLVICQLCRGSPMISVVQELKTDEVLNYYMANVSLNSSGWCSAIMLCIRLSGGKSRVCRGSFQLYMVQMLCSMLNVPSMVTNAELLTQVPRIFFLIYFCEEWASESCSQQVAECGQWEGHWQAVCGRRVYVSSLSHTQYSTTLWYPTWPP